MRGKLLQTCKRAGCTCRKATLSTNLEVFGSEDVKTDNPDWHLGEGFSWKNYMDLSVERWPLQVRAEVCYGKSGSLCCCSLSRTCLREELMNSQLPG